MNISSNNISIKNTGGLLLVACLVLVPKSGWGAITGSAQPAVITIPLGQPTTMTVTWMVASSPPPGKNYTISSSFGQFISPLQKNPLATINTSLNSVVTSVPGTAIMTETVAVPPAVSVLAIRAGGGTIIYQRTFNDGTLSGPVAANILIGGSGSAGFGLSRMVLEFDDGAVLRVVPMKSRLSATAMVSYNGSGSLSGYWEVADPGSTSGTPVFRQMQSVSQGIGGTAHVKMTSPDLPTETPGLHMVRLSVANPLPGFDPPILFYYVGEFRSGTPLSFMQMTVNNPPNRAYVDAATQFSWQPVKDARAYKIEIFANPETASNNLPDMGGAPAAVDPQLIRRALSRPPMAGMLIAPKQSQTTLSVSTRSKLQQQHSYFWRIQAIGADGTVVGEAQVREFRVP